MSIIFKALPTKTVRRLQAGLPDSNAQEPAARISDGSGVPCRHCLENVKKGATFIEFGHRPFETVNPYTETGPIFLCGDACERLEDSGELPPAMKASPQFIVRGYTGDERIRYGTGKVVPTADIVAACEQIFEDTDVAFIHIRSATNNCFYCRVERA
ncbi:DUF1203 domain-containing protein [Hoeflea prorocentri]|uniref:DUF1203 domain-containing protein n=1 Tax=Hoeflea prorocentri TaxID=1922333 RepID=A0A9X3ZJC3_9HYPH|nr:DUF1203 domain-containing protein [Hoeflea prorocentri]MCY6382680.1 DUF1203 domain-containing protein [Hoeflea prorocentri]MDA5400480.1 DUF1203 domain-containing protein [Hoeflea prorocentri]